MVAFAGKVLTALPLVEALAGGWAEGWAVVVSVTPSNFNFFFHILCVDWEIFNHESLFECGYLVMLTVASFSFIILLISVTVILLSLSFVL